MAPNTPPRGARRLGVVALAAPALLAALLGSAPAASAQGDPGAYLWPTR